MRKTFARLGASALAVLLAACSPASLLNLTVPRSGYRVVRDLAYGTDTRQKLDLYIPDSLKAPAPVILFFYGGSWQSGEKAWYLAFGQSFASKGIIVAIADYRLYPKVKYPAFLDDSANALRFVHEKVASYGGDPARLFLAGHSAGAYNAIMLVADPHYLQDVHGDVNWVRGVIGISGPYDFLPLKSADLIDIFGGDRRVDTQPITYIDAKRPPMLLVTGSDDTTVLPRNTKRMAAKLRSFGTDVKEIVYPGVGHIGIILSIAKPFRSRTTLRDDIVNFVNAQER
ncbi:MAG TPA: alpha/beta hydrolase [Rhizomicrobium sp.]